MNKKTNIDNAKLVFEELEPRLLLSADGLGVLTESSVATLQTLVHSENENIIIVQHQTEQSSTVVHNKVQNDSRSELVIIDSRAPNFQQLHNDVIKAQQQGRDINVVILDAHRDGIEQISDALSKYNKLDAVHIVSHGKDAQLQLGATQLNNQNLKQRSDEINKWNQVFSDGGDLLIYGCNLAGSANGTQLVNSLSGLTGADVAASDDVTGNNVLGGDWDLEYQVGDIETTIAFTDDIQDNWQGTLNADALAAQQAAVAEEQQNEEAQVQAEQEAALMAEAEAVLLAEEKEAEIIRQEPEQQAGIVEEQRQEIVFIDESVNDYQAFIEDLNNNNDGSINFEIVLLDSDRDGIEQISETLAAYNDVEAVHIFSHGTDGSVKLGNTWLNAGNLNDYSDSIDSWGSSLDESADILIYGCNLAESKAGEQFVNQLASLTSADVAASDDLTGSDTIGGDWQLEYNTGTIETGIALSETAQAEYEAVLATIIVDNTSDSGIGSLRQAIIDANATVGVTDTITFNIAGGGPHIISLTSALPTITDTIIIDASSEPDYAGDPVVRIDGTSAGAGVNGLTFSNSADGSSVRGLMITRFTGYGIQIDSGADGISITNNWIGTTGTGTTGDGNSNNGINVQGANTIIGGTGVNDGNVITNNGNEGINLTGTGATGTIIQGNIIGLDPDGSTGSGNSDVGIALLSGSHNTTIGGTTEEARNIISMNYEGIEINSNNNTIQGNYIGTDITGTLDRGNDSDDGIEIQNNATGNLIGGTDPGAGNLIAFNALDGVNIVNGNNNAVLGNDIHSNGDQNIDLAAGANSDQAAPVLTSAQTTGSEITISGSLSSTANSYFRIEFFGANQTYLGFVNVATDGSGNATFNTTLTASVVSGTLVTASATKSDVTYSTYSDTSAYSSVVTAGNAGTAIWRDASTTPQTSDWNGSSFGATVASAPSGDYRIMQGAEAPTRDEIIIIGVDESSQINGEIWDGSSWAVVPGSLGSPLGTVSQNYWWGMDVQYESQSGDALMVWTDGANIEYATWNGSSWSGVNTISYSGATPRQLQLAASPNSDEMVLVVSDSNSEDFALVWNGSSWGNEQILEQVAGDDRSDIYVTYEQQSGDAMVVYGKTDVDAYYRIWDGTSWGAEGSVSQAVGTSGDVRWTTLASDPNSDQIALGVTTSNGDTWLNVWDGSSWGTSELATTTSTGTTHPSVAVAFESTSGDLLAAYGESGSSNVKFKTWTSGGGWSVEQVGPNIGGTPNSLMLAADPISDQIMLSAQDSNSDVNYVLWDGSSWGTPTELGTSTTETKNQPFLFLWDQDAGNTAPTFIGNSIGYWNFDEGSGDSVVESAIGISTGTLGSTAGADANDPTWNTGKFGQALHFDGINDYVEIADAPGLDISGPEFSASLWMNPDSGPNQEDMLFMKGDRQGNINYYLSWKDSGEMTWAFKDSAGWHYQDMAVTLPTTGQWNHIAITFDRPTVSLYVNGTKYVFDDVATGGSMDRDLTANNEVMWIGAGRDAGALVGVNQWSGPFTGSIDDLAIFDRALTDAEIEAIRTSTPSVVTATAFSLDENSAINTVVGNVVATDPDIGDTLLYAITAGNTGGAFSIDANGQIKVANSAALDFETNPVFNLTIEATDDGTPAKSDTTSVSISLNDVNDTPTITSNGGGTTAGINVAENNTAITTVAATDADLDTLTYSISGGADGALFNIDSNTGVLTFIAAPNFEVPADANGDNVYEVTVQASDGTDSDTQVISVTVTEVLELVVSNTNATGTGSLHEAILNANANTGVTDTITFNIPGAGPHVISLIGALPAITDTVIINGTTEPDYTGTPIIELDGSSAGAGISGITLGAGSDGSTIRGLVINRFATNGILVDGSDNNTITGNYIGTDVTGNTQAGNDVQATGINVINSSGNVIGGTGAGDANVLSGNRLRGVLIEGSTSTGNTVLGNYIGTNADGSAALTNVGSGQQIGVYLYDAPANTIGGTTADAENIISGNITYGIYAWGPNTSGNEIQGNTIGLDASRSIAIGNGNAGGGGIMLSNAPGNIVGGTVAGAANVISGHLGSGVLIGGVGAIGNTILANEIYANGGLGIDLGSDGVTANDADDADTGANDLQNFPVLTSAETDESTTITVDGSLNTNGLNQDYRIEFFASTSQDGSGYGEAERYLGFATITTDGSGNVTFSETLSVTVAVGEYITATATVDLGAGNYGDTSEFALNTVATVLDTNSPTLVNSTGTTVTEGGTDTITNTELRYDDDLQPATSVTYSVTTSPANGRLEFVSSPGAPITSFTQDDIDNNRVVYVHNGSETISDSFDFSVDDGEGNILIGQSFAITVNPVNDAPTVANLVPDQVATEDTAFSFQFAANTFNDIDVGDTLTYTSDASGWLTFDAATRIFSGTPLNAHVGTTTVTVTADDGNGGTISDTFDIVISNTNDAPTVANLVPDQVATEDNAFTFTFAANTFNDIDVGDTLTYTSDAAGWLSFDAVTRTFSGTPLNADVGTTTVTVTADDGNGSTISDTFDIVISNTNDAPTVANLVPDQIATEDTAFSFQFAANTFKDIDVGDTLTYTSDAAGWLSFDAATRTFSGTPLNADVGTTTVTVTADDGNGGTISDTFDIVISNTNDAPTVANLVPNQVATEDTAFSFQFAVNTFNDADGDTLTYTSDASGWLTFDAATRTFSGTPLNADVGTTTVTATADDGNGGTISDTFDIVISNTNDAPTVANLVPDQVATEDSAFSFQFASNTFNDADGDTLTYTSDASGWLAFDAATRTFSGTPLNADVGTTTVTVTADDGNGGTISHTFDIVISNTNDAPVLTGANDLNSIAEDDISNSGTRVSDLLSGHWSDADTAPQSGIAIVGADNTNGSWEYTIDNGSNWMALGSPSSGSARLLAADASTLVRFVPSADYNGTVTNGITFHAWDQTTGNNGDEINLSGLDSSADSFSTVSYSNNDGTVPWTTDWIETDNAGGGASGGYASVNAGSLQLQLAAGDSGDNIYREIDLSGATVANLSFDYQNVLSGEDEIRVQVSNNGGSSYSTIYTFSGTVNTGSGSANLDISSDISSDTRIRFFVFKNDAGNNLFIDNLAVSYDNGDPLPGGDTAFSALTQSSDITVTPVDDAPTVDNVIPDQTASEDTAYSFTFVANTFGNVDASDTLTYSATLGDNSALPTWLTFNAGTRTFSGTPANSDVATISVKVTADDGTSTIADTFTLTVNNTNDAPVLAAIGNQSINELATLSFTATATDSDLPADTLTFSLDASSIAAGMSIDANTGVFSWTPTEAQGGTSPSVTVTVTDNGNGNLVDSEAFTITVGDTNTAPVLGTIGNQTVDELVNLTFTATATDSDLPVDTLTFSLDATSLAAGMAINANTGVFSWTPTEAQGGTSPSVTVTVTDNGTGNLVDSETFTITVADTNTAPVLGVIGNQTVDELVNLTFTATASDSDLPVDTLTFSLDATSLAAGMTIDANTGVFSWTPTEAQGGTTPTVTITVTDSGTGNLIDSEIFTITVNDVNVAPVLGVIGNQTVDELATLTFTATATDSDLPADTLTFSLDAASITEGMTIDANTGVFSWTPTEAQGGTTPSVIITVTDSGTGNLIDSETFTITVNDVNVAPVLGVIGNQTVDELATLAFTATATDSDLPADTLTFSLDAASIAAGMSIDGVTGDFSWTPTGAQGGTTASVTVIVTDNGTGNLVDSETFTITVYDAPVANNDSAIVNEGQSVNINLAANDTDAEGVVNLTSIVITSAPLNGSVVVNADGTVNYTHDGSETIADSFAYTILDASGVVSNVATVSLTINPVNDAPTALNDTPAAVDEGGAAIFDLAVNDFDLDNAIDLNSIVITSAPANGSLITNGDGTVTYLHDGGETTSDTFAYIIADIAGAISNTASVNITVNPVNDAPVIVANTGLVATGIDSITITNVQLNVNDIDNSNTELMYTITALPDNGELTINGVAAAIGSSFSEEDIINNTVSYQSGGTGTNDQFGFTISDGEGGSITGNSFNIVVQLAAVPAEEPVDPEVITEPEKLVTPEVLITPVTRSAPTVEEGFKPIGGNSTPQQQQPVLTIEPVVEQEVVEHTEEIDESYVYEEEPEVSKVDFTTARSYADIQVKSIEALWMAIDEMKQDMSENVTKDISNIEFRAAAISSSGVVLTAGVVAWVLRSGALMASLISTIPLWKGYDPLPLLVYKDDEEEEKITEDKIPTSLEELKKVKALKEKMQQQMKVDRLFGHSGIGE